MHTKLSPLEDILAAADLVPTTPAQRERAPRIVAEGRIVVNGMTLRAIEDSSGHRSVDPDSLHEHLDPELAATNSPAADLRRQAAILEIFHDSELTQAESAIVRASQAPFTRMSHAEFAQAIAQPESALMGNLHDYLFGAPLNACTTCSSTSHGL